MKVTQISVFVENKSGRLAALTRVLGDSGVNIRALSIADTSDFGILRMICNDPDRAYGILRDGGYAVSKTDVIAVEVPDRPGGLANILGVIGGAGLNVEYMYAFVEKSSGNALVIIRLDDLDKGIQALAAAGVKVVEARRVYAI